MIKIQKSIYFIGLLFFSLPVWSQAFQTLGLRCEYKENPIGVDVAVPRLSWKLKSNQRNVLQTAYRILVADDPQIIARNRGNIWDSRKVSSSSSIQIEYGGKALQATKTYYWKVMTWTNKSRSSGWSKIATWQMGLLHPSDWQGAKWIAYEDLPPERRILPSRRNKENPDPPKPRNVLPLLRKEFEVSKPVKRATAYVAGLGQFEMSLNGEKVGDHYLDPAWTDYEDHALYVTFDLTPLIKQGRNVMGVMLGNGFYHIPKERYKKLLNSYGYPKMIGRLLVEYTDGTKQDVVSDSSWTTAPGPITYSSIYGGEDYNANLEQPGWNTPVFRENSLWKRAITVDGPPLLQSQMSTPVKIFENFKPVKVTQPKPGSWVYDLGQNASGIVRIKVRGHKGDSVKLIPGELVDEKGLVTQKATGSPYNFVYILKGEGDEVWQPRFTYYGFRYVQVDGATPEGAKAEVNSPVITELKGLHTRNSAERAGYFSCSSDLFNRTERLIDWAIKSNMQSVFTDCPHREKLGWLEESHLVGSSIHFQYDIQSIGEKIVRDMQYAQTEEGLIPEIAPEYTIFTGSFRDSPEWGSNGIIMPWYLYQWYGDKRVLLQSYPMMQKYLVYLASKAKDHILRQGLSDWYDLGPDRPGFSQLTPNGVTATAIYYYDLNIVSQIATLLGYPEDARNYDSLAKEVKLAFNRTFFNSGSNQYASGSQTSNAMAIYMGLVDAEHKEAVLANLVKDIRSRNNSFTSGDIGFRYLIQTLSNENLSNVIFDMNSRSDVPGYGYQIAHGATALTESWQASRSVSNNHFMLGDLLEWFYSGLTGIKCNERAVGYKAIDIRPEPVGDITFSKAAFETPYGQVACEWRKKTKMFELAVEIPANTTATIYIPCDRAAVIREGENIVSNEKGVRLVGYENGRKILAVGSGIYHFKAVVK